MIHFHVRDYLSRKIMLIYKETDKQLYHKQVQYSITEEILEYL